MTDQKDIKTLQAEGKGPAPCARFCEAAAFNIEIASLQRRCDYYINQWSKVCNDNQVLINERDALAAQIETLRYEADGVLAIKDERDALTNAARLALDALENLHGIDTETEAVTIWVDEEIAALKAVL